MDVKNRSGLRLRSSETIQRSIKTLCVFSIIGDDFTGQYRFKKGFYGLSDIPTVFQEHIDKVWNLKHLSGQTITFVLLMGRQKITNGNYEMSYPNYKKRDTERTSRTQNCSKTN